ncbi:MAG: sugar phosphate isomerase/epimerase [Clostridiales bacterium]|nr:sugar phosphate isomerase/epimerase [Clostridiales bacterium]
MSRIGLQMYTLRDFVKTPEDFKATIRKVADIGIKHVQITPPGYFTVAETAEILRSNGISADSVFRSTGKVVESIESAKRDADILGVDVLRTDSIPSEMRKDADGYRRYAELMNAEGRACKAAGLRYIYHFHAFEWITFGDVRGIDILLNETDPDAVMFQPDVFWLTNAGTEPSTSLKMFNGRAFFMHVKDYAIKQLEGKIENVPYNFASVGTGNLNWQGIIKAADEIGIERFVIEQDMCDGDPFEAVKLSFENLNKMGIK